MNDNSIEDRVKQIEIRNKRVEIDKAWETSLTRKIAIAILTYLVVVLYLYFVMHIDPWLNAIIPVCGFLLSTISISYLNKVWVNNNFKK